MNEKSEKKSNVYDMCQCYIYHRRVHFTGKQEDNEKSDGNESIRSNSIGQWLIDS